jgi:aspartate/methionine/tyrosine aminotransferase
MLQGEPAPRELNRVFQGQGTTIFTVMSALAVQHNAINLGQGFPDVDGPEEIRAEAARRLIEGPNQYPHMAGIAELRQAVANHNKTAYGLDFDWQSEVLVTSGATEALTDSLMALLNPGDEAILLEPFYDCYLPIIEQTGAVAKIVPLKPPNWDVPFDMLETAFSNATKLIVLNSPMNPCAKTFNPSELDAIGALLQKYDAYAICDEVYENLVFDDRAHIPLMTRPGLFERCVRIGSAGKTFSFTGWKVGYISGPQQLIATIAKAHQFVTFATPPALQYAVAFGLENCQEFVSELQRELQDKRDFLRHTLEAIGLKTLPCDATYFLTADVSGLGFEGDDAAFCKYITEQAKVAAIPLSAFYHPASTHAPKILIRFCFCKRQDVMEQAARRLERHFLKP